MRNRRTKKYRAKYILILIAFIVFTIFLWWHYGTSPAATSNATPIVFTVQKGEGVKAIASDLRSQRLIRDPFIFYLLVKKLHLENRIQAGDFRIAASQTPESIAKALTTGTLDVWITIPEGKRADEIADILKEKLPTYQESWRTQLDALEGYLFPDTYLIPHGAGINEVISTLKNNFDAKYKVLNDTYHPTQTQSEIVTIASLVEREAKFAPDRPLVASVIYNRLQVGMALQLDATVQYAIGTESLWWKNNLTTDDLQVESPYNTDTHTGIPPSPIANPGADSLAAAMNPAKTQYIYYISDNSGHNHYAKTLDEQSANIKKYGL